MAVETVAEHEIEDLTAGQRLKAAREAHQLDRNEIARWLKLDEKFIKAIEEDDEEHLPQPVFIAGYIRSYAKLVASFAKNPKRVEKEVSRVALG